ncbi:MAG: S-layer homology domain-containing protein [Clostridiales bacterium]|nr:S-layer homology domain-containing protein [Clostridiales bacterium]
MKRKIFTLLPAVCLVLGAYALAQEPDINYRVNDEGVMTLGGSGVSEQMCVNIQITGENGARIFLEQTTGDENGEFSFSVDLEKALPYTGSYTLHTAAQNGQSGSADFDYCKKQDLESVVISINAEKAKPQADSNGIAQILKDDDNSNVLTKIDPVVKEAFADNLYEGCAKLLLAEEDINNDNIKSIMKKICAVGVLPLKSTADEVSELFEDYGENLNTESIKDFSNLDDKTRAMLFLRISGLSDSYDSMEDFYTTVYHNIILAKLDLVNGTGGIDEVLKTYGDVFDFTAFNNANNDQNAVLKKISKAFEDKTIKTVEEIQIMLNENILKTASGSGTGSASGGGSVSGSGSIGGSDVNFSKPVTPKRVEFGDLGGFEWAEESIDKLVSLGVVNGVSDTEFAPGRNVTRAEFCAFMCRLFGEREAAGQPAFLDVSQDDWFFGYVNAMYQSGVVEGTEEGRFSPAEPVTRQDAAVIIYRALMKYSSARFEDDENIAFNDNASIAEYALEAIGNLRAAGIVNGKSDNNFEPGTTMLRAEAAQMMINTYNFIESGAGK